MKEIKSFLWANPEPNHRKIRNRTELRRRLASVSRWGCFCLVLLLRAFNFFCSFSCSCCNSDWFILKHWKCYSACWLSPETGGYEANMANKPVTGLAQYLFSQLSGVFQSASDSTSQSQSHFKDQSWYILLTSPLQQILLLLLLLLVLSLRYWWYVCMSSGG